MGALNYYTNESFPVSSMVIEPSDIIIVPFQIIDDHFDFLAKDNLKSFQRVYPSTEEVKTMYMQSLKWKQFRQDLFQAKLYDTKKMKRERENTREVISKVVKLPEDIVAFICNKPKPLFIRRKRVVKQEPSKIVTKHTSTALKELPARLDYESSATRQSSAADIDMLQTAVPIIHRRRTVLIDDRRHSDSFHYSIP